MWFQNNIKTSAALCQLIMKMELYLKEAIKIQMAANL